MRLCFIILLLLPNFGHAGAWVREKGETFLSYSYEQFEDSTGRESFTSGYMEYGLTDRLTVGIDDGRSQRSGANTTIAFARIPLTPQNSRNKFTLELGAGALQGESPLTNPILRPGVSWGRSIQTRFGSGWVNIDALAEYRTLTHDTASKADATIGLNAGKKTKLMVQFNAGNYPTSDPYLRVAPSILHEVYKGVHVQLGARKGLSGDTSTGFKLGTWLSF